MNTWYLLSKILRDDSNAIWKSCSLIEDGLVLIWNKNYLHIQKQIKESFLEDLKQKEFWKKITHLWKTIDGMMGQAWSKSNWNFFC